MTNPLSTLYPTLTLIDPIPNPNPCLSFLPPPMGELPFKGLFHKFRKAVVHEPTQRRYSTQTLSRDQFTKFDHSEATFEMSCARYFSGCGSKLKMAERLEDREKKSGSDF